MPESDRVQAIGKTILELLEKRGTLPNDYLYERVESEYPDLEAREYTSSLEQLKTLDLIEPFDGGYDRIFEITRKGVCVLTDE